MLCRAETGKDLTQDILPAKSVKTVVTLQTNENVMLFENATVYIPNEEGKLPNENKVVTIGMYGNVDFYLLKGICDNILTLAGISGARYTAVCDNPSYHPGRTAELSTKDGVKLAILGQVHPSVMANYGISIPVYAAELDFDAIFANMTAEKLYTPLPKFPATTRDFSFVCEEALEVGKIEDVMTSAGGKLVTDISVFDIYRGPQVGENRKSVSMRVTLRASDRTLTVEEADKVSTKILAALEKQLGIVLRS